MKRHGNLAWRVALGTAGSAIAAYGIRKALTRRTPEVIEAEQVVSIRKPTRELAELWRGFEDAPVGMEVVAIDFEESSRGTIVRAAVRYDVKMGKTGAIAQALMGHDPSVLLREHLRRFKQLAEAGEIATNESPSARREPKPEPGTTLAKPIIDAADAVKTVKKAKKRSAKKTAERNLP